MIERNIFHTGAIPPALAYGLGVVAALVVIAMLVRELRRKQQVWRWAVAVVRLGMVAILTLLIAQPNLVEVRTTEEPGQLLMVVDDSASMFVSDQLDNQQSLMRLASLLQLPEVQDRELSAQRAAAELGELRRALAGLHDACRRAADAVRMGFPWPGDTEAVLEASQTHLRRLHALLSEVQANESFPANLRRQAAELSALIGDDAAPEAPRLALLGLMRQPPAQESWLRLAEREAQLHEGLEALHEAMISEQANADAAFLAQPGKLEAIQANLASTNRHDFAWQALERLNAGSGTILNLNQAGTATGTPLTAGEAAGQTDLVKPLVDMLADRPLDLLDAVVLVSDGGQNLTFDLSQLDAFRRRRIPLIVAGVGGTTNSAPLRLVEQAGPVMVTEGRPTNLRLTFEVDARTAPGSELTITFDLTKKTTPDGEEKGAAASAEDDATAAQRSVRDRLSRFRQRTTSQPTAGTEESATGDAKDAVDAFPHTEKIAVDERGRARLNMPLKIGLSGFNSLHYSASLSGGSAKLEGTLPLYVAPERPRILLIAERPDPFSVALLAQRQYGVLVYPIFTYGRAQKAVRGSTRGAVPETPEDWGQYDLVVFMGTPFPGFSEADMTAISGYLRKGDLSVLAIGAGAQGYVSALDLDLTGSAMAMPAEAVRLHAQIDHFPLVRLESEVIANINAWQSFGAPKQVSRVAGQDAPVLRHPLGDVPVLSLGLHGAGKLVLCGIEGVEPMLAWQAPAFDRFVTHLVADLLTPLRQWPENGPALAAYPPVGTAGRSVLLVGRPEASGAPATVQIDGPDGQIETVLAPAGDWLKGQVTLTEPGDYTISGIGEPVTYTVRQLESTEVRDVSLNEPFLRELAAAADGRFVELAVLPEALESLAARSRAHVDSTTWRLLDFRWSLFLIFFILAGLDFTLRKFLGLVL